MAFEIIPHLINMNKICRYGLVFGGCIAQTIIIRVIGSLLSSSDASQPHLALKQELFFGLLLTWPAWSIPLWCCGWKGWTRVVGVVIPFAIGLVILRPLGEGLFGFLMILLGAHT